MQENSKPADRTRLGLRGISKTVGIRGLAIAVALVIATNVLRAVLAEALGERPMMILYILPIILSAWIGGWRPGLLATVLSTLSTVVLPHPADFLSNVDRPHDLLQWGFLWVSGIAVCVTVEQLHRKRREVEAYRCEQTDLAAARKRALDALAIEKRKLEASSQENEALAQKERAARERVENALRMRNEFLAKVTHELRTPISVIGGWVEILKLGGGQGRTTEIYEILERNTKQELLLIDELLEVSRLDRGKVDIVGGRVVLEDVIEHALETIRFAAEQKRITVDAALEPNETVVHGDQHKLEQVVWNLLSNAVKFTPAGGRVSVTLSHRDGTAQIQIRDTGVGIKPEFLPRMFDPFEQQDGGLTRNFGGLGLGLSIVKSLVDLHGGEISAYSEGEGSGSTFTVSLPSASPSVRPPARVQPQPAPPMSLRGMHILVVDDMPDALGLLEVMLARAGARVTVAESAAEAMEVLEREVPDVIVSDLSMPGRDGCQLLQDIRTLPGAAGRIPAIALSGHSGTEFVERAISAGFHEYLTKPARLPSLARACLASRGTHAARPGEPPCS